MINIFDCLCFNEEFDILWLRLNELSKIDNLKHIIVESNRTQSLIEKPYHLEENKERFSDFADRIIHIKIDASDWSNQYNLWNAENAQRNYILQGLERAGANNQDYVIIGDADEIPNSDVLSELINNQWNETGGLMSFDMMFSAYFYNLIAHRKWIGSVVTNYKKVKQLTPQGIRNFKDTSFRIDGGWHFSWIMPPEKLLKKAQSCIEPYDKSKLPTLDQFDKYFEQYKNKQNKHFIHIEDLARIGEPFSKIEIDNNFPEYLVKNQDKYSQFIL